MPTPPLVFHCPLPAEDLLFQSMSVSAGLGQLGEMQLHLLSEKEDIAPDKLLGQLVRVLGHPLAQSVAQRIGGVHPQRGPAPPAVPIAPAHLHGLRIPLR